MVIFLYVLKAFLSLFFLFAGSIKVSAWHKKIFAMQLENYFKKFNLNRKHMFVVGILEVLGALGIWFLPGFIGLIAADILAVVSLGAIYFHLRYDTIKEALFAILTLILASTAFIISWLNLI